MTKKKTEKKNPVKKNEEKHRGALAHAILEAGETALEKGTHIPLDLTRQIGRPIVQSIMLPQRVVMQIADEVVERLKRKRPEKKTQKVKVEAPIYLDTSAILDERLFELIKLGVFYGNFVLIDGVLSELKHIADLKDDIKKERGRRALRALEDIKKQKNVKLITEKDDGNNMLVDDKIIHAAKKSKGRIITCDYNLSKKARISGIVAIDIHEVANALKTQAIPGETFYVKVIQVGKGEGQGVGYLPDGTMIVVENGAELMGKTVQVTVSRIIQTEAGKILFSKIQ